MTKLIVIRGPLGVGKTTVSKILAEKLGAEYLSLDNILDDNNLIPANSEGIPVEIFLRANEIILEIVEKSQRQFILDGCFYYQEQIDDLKRKTNGDILFISLVGNVDTCVERDSERSRSYGKDAAEFVHGITIKIKEGHEIDTTNLSIEETVNKILDKIIK